MQSCLYETRHFEDCWQQAVARPASLVALEAIPAHAEALVATLVRYRLALPQLPVLVLASRQMEPWQWFLRELGAVHVVFSPRALGPLVRIVQRHWNRLDRESTLPRTLVWRRLPWAEQSGRCPQEEPAWLTDPDV
jgi:hypothetical protein